MRTRIRYENPRVGGSIPPQPPNMKSPSDAMGFFLKSPCGGIAGLAQLVERYLAKV